jgi:hypothetical protein|nr:MAG TPA: hypothetical protein [Caudoviricetes sp.]
MSIVQKTPMSEIDSYIEAMMKRKIDALIYNLKYVGERCLNAARDSNAYRDQTGNLRSSVGYVIVRDGEIIHQSDFEIVKKGNKGSKSGIRYAKEIVRQFPEGIVLIIVAGMNYATHVAATGRDVIDSAELLADRLVPELLRQLGFSK